MSHTNGDHATEVASKAPDAERKSEDGVEEIGRSPIFPQNEIDIQASGGDGDSAASQQPSFEATSALAAGGEQ